MKLNRIDFLELQFFLFHLIKKQSQIVGAIGLRCIILNVPGIVEGLVEVHKIEFVTLGMQKIFCLFQSIGFGKKIGEITVINIADYPFRTKVFFFKGQVKNNINLLPVSKKSCRHFRIPILVEEVQKYRMLFVGNIIDKISL